METASQLDEVSPCDEECHPLVSPWCFDVDHVDDSDKDDDDRGDDDGDGNDDEDSSYDEERHPLVIWLDDHAV